VTLQIVASLTGNSGVVNYALEASIMLQNAAIMLLESSIMLIEASIMLIETSIMLLNNAYSTGVTQDDRHLRSSYFYSTDHKLAFHPYELFWLCLNMQMLNLAENAHRLQTH
jgi:hypothetical protein